MEKQIKVSTVLWKNFIIRTITDEDIVKLEDYLTANFHSDEPMGKLVPPDEDFIKITNYKMEQLVRAHKDICIVAVDTNTGEIAGLQLQFVWKKDDAMSQRIFREDYSPPPSRMRRFMDAVYFPMNDRRYGIFDDFGVTEVVWNFLASTGRNYRGIGLSSELYGRMVELLREKGHKIVYSVFSSPLSRKSATKVGFKEIARSHYHAAKDENGQHFVPHANKEDFAAVMVLDLSRNDCT